MSKDTFHTFYTCIICLRLLILQTYTCSTLLSNAFLPWHQVQLLARRRKLTFTQDNTPSPDSYLTRELLAMKGFKVGVPHGVALHHREVLDLTKRSEIIAIAVGTDVVVYLCFSGSCIRLTNNQSCDDLLMHLQPQSKQQRFRLFLRASTDKWTWWRPTRSSERYNLLPCI